MNKQEWIDLMQSDGKLWDMAEKEMDGTNMKLTLRGLPWGIGDAEVTLEGMDNAIAKRNAVGSYAEYIRGLIDEQINDEAITIRAAQAAAFASEDASELPVDERIYTGPGRVEGERTEVQEVASQEAVQAPRLPASGAAGPADRISQLRGFITQAEGVVTDARASIAKAHKEIEALNAYMEVINAQEQTDTTEEDQ
jgi:hypothetical protein